MTEFLRIPLQLAAYAIFAYCLGHFSTAPVYRYGDPAKASIKVSLSHATARVKPCVPLTPEQIAELAANMRRTESCERARLPLILELEIDGKTLLHVTAKPTGLWSDGPASVYERFDVEPGSHHLTAKLRDSARTDGWDYAQSADVELMPGRYFAITFKAETGGFKFQ